MQTEYKTNYNAEVINRILLLLRIVDRKKDLVKLQFGEYISLGRVESGKRQLASHAKRILKF